MFVASVASATAILAVPSKEVPPIFLAVAKAVAVAALPVVLPEVPEVFQVTLPVRVPTNPVAVTLPVLGL